MPFNQKPESPPGQTCFVTANTYQKKCVLQSERMAKLLIETLYHYRRAEKFHLHEFVVMPNHLHLLFTPAVEVTLERAMQLVKGGFSFRAGKEFGARYEIWQTSFHDRRIRNWNEYQQYRRYIRENPVTARLARVPGEFPFSSASGGFELDEIPQRLKPVISAC